MTATSGLKVILAVDAIHRPLTGIGRYTWELSQGLGDSEKIQDLRYFSHNGWVKDPGALLAPGRLESARSLRTTLARSKLATTAYAMLMPKLMGLRLRSKKDFLFHSPNFFLPPCPGPTVATFHDLSIYDHPEFHPEARVDFMRRLIPKALERATLVIAVSEYTRQRIIERFDLPPDRVHAVLQGVDHRQFAPADPADAEAALAELGLTAKAYTLCVSTIEPRKNLDRLIIAYRALPHSVREQCPLVLVGDRGWRSEETHASIHRAVAEGWLHYHGYVPERQLRTLLAQSTLFIFPSLHEGFGLPVLEAMASGVPVLASDLLPIREFAGDSIGYFDPTEEEALPAALHKALDDSTWRESAARAAYRCSTRFTWGHTVDQTITAYQAARSRHAGQ